MVTLIDSPRARRTDDTASHEAADSNDIHGARAVVLSYLKLGMYCDHELIADYLFDARMIGNTRPYTPQRLRTARAELVESGQVEALGIYRLTGTGRRAQVWGLVK